MDEEENESYRIEEAKDCTEGHFQHPRTGVSVCTLKVFMVRSETSRFFASLNTQNVLTGDL